MPLHLINRSLTTERSKLSLPPLKVYLHIASNLDGSWQFLAATIILVATRLTFTLAVLSATYHGRCVVQIVRGGSDSLVTERSSCLGRI